MPEQYLRIKHNLMAKGKSEEEAKRIAAATYNKQHPDKPLSKDYDEKHDNKKGKKKPARKKPAAHYPAPK